MSNKQNVLKICPPKSSFEDCKTNIKCPIPNCDKVLYTSGSLRMHLSRSHGVCENENDAALNTRTKVQNKIYTEYHCPHEGCIYSEKSERHFTSMANLKQHYLRIHAEKKFKCNKCGCGFGMEKIRKRHEGQCGKIFTCSTCQCTYISLEALFTHCSRTQHPVPEEHVRKKTSKPVKSNINQTGKCPPQGSQQMNGVKIPILLLPVPSNSLQNIQHQLKLLPSKAKTDEVVSTIQRSISDGTRCPKEPHLKDHDYSVGKQVHEVETMTENKEKSQAKNSSVAETKVQSSGIQTTISFRPILKKKDNITQTTGDIILRQAMASADIQIESSSVGIQVTPKNKKKQTVDTHTQVTPSPRSKNKKCGKSAQNHNRRGKGSRKKLHKNPVADLGIQTAAMPHFNENKNLQNNRFIFDNFNNVISAGVKSHVTETRDIGMDNITSNRFQYPEPMNRIEVTESQFPIHQNNYMSQFSVNQNQMSCGTHFSKQLMFSNVNTASTSTSVTDLNSSQTIGVQTYTAGESFQDFLLSPTDRNGYSTNSIAINTDNSTYNQLHKNNDKFLSNKCVGNDATYFTDSNVQTVDFDFLTDTLDPQTQVMNMETQTVDFDIDSLESLVSSIETQTGSDYGLSSFDVHTQTHNSSSVNTQTKFDSPMDTSSYPSSNIQTQTYDEFIELLSSSTQTLNYGFLDEVPSLSLIDIETQTPTDVGTCTSKFNFGTQTSLIENVSVASSEQKRSVQYSEPQNVSHNNLHSEQMEFLVSEVLEMIPVETESVPISLYKKPQFKLSHDKRNSYSEPNCQMIECSSSSNLVTSNRITNSCTEVAARNTTLPAEVNNRITHTQSDATDVCFEASDNRNSVNVPVAVGIDNDLQKANEIQNVGYCDRTKNSDVQSNIRRQTGTGHVSQDLTNSETQTGHMLQDLTNSQTQTMLKGQMINTDLTDSHTQTTWQELNDLLTELDQ